MLSIELFSDFSQRCYRAAENLQLLVDEFRAWRLGHGRWEHVYPPAYAIAEYLDFEEWPVGARTYILREKADGISLGKYQFSTAHDAAVYLPIHYLHELWFVLGSDRPETSVELDYTPGQIVSFIEEWDESNPLSTPYDQLRSRYLQAAAYLVDREDEYRALDLSRLKCTLVTERTLAIGRMRQDGVPETDETHVETPIEDGNSGSLRATKQNIRPPNLEAPVADLNLTSCSEMTSEMKVDDGGQIEPSGTREYGEVSSALNQSIGSEEQFVFEEREENFYIQAFGEKGHPPTSKGLQQLRMLVLAAGRQVSVEELARLEFISTSEYVEGEELSVGWKLREQMVDAETIASIDMKIRELDNDIAEEASNGDTLSLEELAREKEKLEAERRKVVNHRGEPRPMANRYESQTRSIRGNINRAYKSLAQGQGMTKTVEHFKVNVKYDEGQYCYTPGDPAPDWDVK